MGTRIRMSTAMRSDGDGAVSEVASVTCDSPTCDSPTARSAPHKQLKFVPYEPYKAAVAPMTPAYRKRCACQALLGHAVYPELLSESIRHEETKRQQTEQELKQLRDEKESLENQLKVQTQVNAELKKLLVASIGEDLQCRVQSMTEDKTLLAHNIVRYSEKLHHEMEQLDQVSIQCDVWRSKYLASSMLVDELVRLKTALSHQLDGANEAIHALLDEYDSMGKNLQIVYRSISTPQDSAYHSDNSPKLDIVQLSSALVHTITATRPELLPLAEIPVPYSHGQRMARQVLHNMLTLPISRSSSCISVSRFHPATSYEKITFYCCSHCQGDVQVI